MAISGAAIIAAGLIAGAFASRITTESIVWQRPSEFPRVEGSAQRESVDQASAGRSWAQSAFNGGLKRCPEMNVEFLAACQAEMKALLARPTIQHGGYGGPLLVTKMERAYREPALEPLPDDYIPLEADHPDVHRASHEAIGQAASARPAPTGEHGLPQAGTEDLNGL
jgi:hypothetical protein